MVSKIRGMGAQDSDRPHYYSQFWIDVATGKQTNVAVPEIAEPTEDEDDELEKEILSLASRPEPKAKVAKPVERKPETRQPLTSLADLANIDMLMKSSAAMDDDEAPDISAGLSADSAPDIVFDMDNGEAAGSDQYDDEYDEDEEDEEDDDWGGGRRKSKPSKSKRHERRDF
jgi:hypothetical protein